MYCLANGDLRRIIQGELCRAFLMECCILHETFKTDKFFSGQGGSHNDTCWYRADLQQCPGRKGAALSVENNAMLHQEGSTENTEKSHSGAVRLTFSRSSTAWTTGAWQISSASLSAMSCTALTTLGQWRACKVWRHYWRPHVHGIRGEPCALAPAA